MLQTLNATSTSLTLSWNAPAEPNGIVRHYLVLVEETDTNHNHTVVSYSNVQFTVGGLHPYYTYELSVQAVTITSGPPSTILSVQTLQDGKYCTVCIGYDPIDNTRSYQLGWPGLSVVQSIKVQSKQKSLKLVTPAFSESTCMFCQDLVQYLSFTVIRSSCIQ